MVESTITSDITTEQLKQVLDSKHFALFLDQELRDYAIQCVHNILKALEDHAAEKNKAGKWVKRSQVQAMNEAVQAQGLTGLINLAKQQIDKQTKEENRVFWTYLKNVLSLPTSNIFSASTLSGLLIKYLRNRGVELQDPDKIQDKKERKKVRTYNKKIIDQALNQALPYFCEHLICHYYYITS